MRRSAAFVAVLALVALAYAPRAEAYGFRIGGTSIVDPGTDHMFSIGTDNDTMFVEFVGLNTGGTFHVNGDYLGIDYFLGVIGKIPVAVGGKLKVTLRGDFLLKYNYIFDSNWATHFINIGGIVGPGIEFDLGNMAVGFDVDVQFYKQMWVDEGPEADDFVVAVSYMAALHF